MWRADLEAVGDGLSELLDDGERERAARMLRDGDRLLWTRARGVLRALLGRYLEADPRTLRFATGAHGKPALAEHERLFFNLSHSGEIALYAFAQGNDVGVDLEVDRRVLDRPALAARAFGVAEARRLEALGPQARQREFLQTWTRHEAALKCRGTGIGAYRADAQPEGLWITELELGARAIGALAVEGHVRELRCWEWA